MGKVIKKKELSKAEKKVVDEVVDDEELEEVTPKTKGVSVNDILKTINSKYGERTMLSLKEKPDFPRIPTGVFPVDFMIGGGIPVSQGSCFMGGYSGGKTTTGLNTVACFQKMCMSCYRPSDYCVCSTKPKIMKAAVANIEGTIDPLWASTLGVDIENFYLIEAEAGEAYIDICQKLMEAEDLGFLLFDSVGAMVTQAELDNAAEASNMGVSARVISKMVNKFKQSLITQNKLGHQIALLYINQKRLDLQVKFGSNETTKGGEAFKHEQSLTCRFGKLSLDAGDNAFKGDAKEDRPFVSKHSVIINKAKIYTLGGSCSFKRSIDYVDPELGNAAGKVLDSKMIVKYAKEYGVLGDDPKKMEFVGKEYKTAKELIASMFHNTQLKLMLSMATVEAAKMIRRAGI